MNPARTHVACTMCGAFDDVSIDIGVCADCAAAGFDAEDDMPEHVSLDDVQLDTDGNAYAAEADDE